MDIHYSTLIVQLLVLVAAIVGTGAGIISRMNGRMDQIEVNVEKKVQHIVDKIDARVSTMEKEHWKMMGQIGHTHFRAGSPVAHSERIEPAGD